MVWGIGEFVNRRDDVAYIKCKNEEDLLSRVSYILGKDSTRYNYRGIQSSLIFLICIIVL